MIWWKRSLSMASLPGTAGLSIFTGRRTILPERPHPWGANLFAREHPHYHQCQMPQEVCQRVMAIPKHGGIHFQGNRFIRTACPVFQPPGNYTSHIAWPWAGWGKVVILQFREHLTCRSFLALVSEVQAFDQGPQIPGSVHTNRSKFRTNHPSLQHFPCWRPAGPGNQAAD